MPPLPPSTAESTAESPAESPAASPTASPAESPAASPTASPIHDGKQTSTEPPPPPPPRPSVSAAVEKAKAEELAKMKEHLARLKQYLVVEKSKSGFMSVFRQASETGPVLPVTYASLPSSKSLNIQVYEEKYDVEALKKHCNQTQWNDLCNASRIKELLSNMDISEAGDDVSGKISAYKLRIASKPLGSDMGPTQAADLLLILYIEQHPKQVSTLLEKANAESLDVGEPDRHVKQRGEDISALETFRNEQDTGRMSIDSRSTSTQTLSEPVAMANELAVSENRPTDSLIRMWEDALNYAEKGTPEPEGPCSSSWPCAVM